MGVCLSCCYSLCKEDANQNGEVNERTHLLVDPVSNNINSLPTNSDDLLSRNLNAFPKKTDEQSALNRILQETATNVIDVAALDSHNLQQHEYLERMKHYSQRLQQACQMNKIPPIESPCLLQDVPNPEKILSSDPINPDDYALITSVVARAAVAINDIKVEHKEDLVVPFRIS